jgi:hypothetical protein
MAGRTDLANILRAAIEPRIDRDAWPDVLLPDEAAQRPVLGRLAVQLGPVSVDDLACLNEAFVVIVNQHSQRPEDGVIRR